ncbi:MAG: SAM-dependent methyltransferase [Alicyclobacillaceae bacterium]|nr:SAM-dependent methyltransferase [Alicyclobacillaceae bacterium]
MVSGTIDNGCGGLASGGGETVAGNGGHGSRPPGGAADGGCVRLSGRLLRLAREVPAGARLVDVGSDHALLPIHLVETGQVSYAIATDRAAGPCQAALANVRRHGCHGRVSVRCGPGLATVRPGEVDTIIIAGLGGRNAAEILSASPDVVRAASRIVLQPMGSHGLLRRTLHAMGLALRKEAVFPDSGHLYVMCVADWQGDPDDAYGPYFGEAGWLDLAYELGPLLLRRPTPPFLAWVRGVLDRWTRIEAGLARGREAPARRRQQELSARLERLRCWLREAEIEGEEGLTSDWTDRR